MENGIKKKNSMLLYPRVKCAHCGKEMAGRFAKGGDGTFIFPRLHNIWVDLERVRCKGSFEEAISI